MGRVRVKVRIWLRLYTMKGSQCNVLTRIDEHTRVGVGVHMHVRVCACDPIEVCPPSFLKDAWPAESQTPYLSTSRSDILAVFSFMPLSLNHLTLCPLLHHSIVHLSVSFRVCHCLTHLHVSFFFSPCPFLCVFPCHLSYITISLCTSVLFNN